jgi:hypothetical protein
MAALAALTVTRAAPAPEKPEPSPAASVSPAPKKEDAPASRQQITITARIVALSKSAVQQLKTQKGEAQSPDLAPLIDQLAAIFGENANGLSSAPTAVFSVSQVLADDQYQSLLRRLNGVKGADLMSAPSVTARPEQKATIELVREFRYPTKFDHRNLSGVKPVLTPTDFETKNLGLTLETEGSLSSEPEIIDFTVNWRMADLLGYVSLKDGKPVSVDQLAPADDPQEDGKTKDGKSLAADVRPVFNTQSLETCVTMHSGATLMLGSHRRNPGSWRGPDFPASINEEAILLNFITVKIIDAPPLADGKESAPLIAKIKALLPAAGESPAPTSSPSPNATGESPAASPPTEPKLYATPVKDKPGFVISPYAPDSGYIDVRGFPSGAEVRDPYTNKFFLVP